MYDEHIRMIDDWFKKHKDYGTYHNEDEYVVRAIDMKDFCDLISEITDLIYLPCTVNAEGIFFRAEDLHGARYY